jgi:hypothetical protein
VTRSDYTPPTFTDVPQAQWGSPPVGAVALDAAHLNALAQAVGNSARQARFDVRDYGATGNGTTDDTTALQAAIAALPANGGTLYFPQGTYLISGTLDFGSRLGVKVVGEGKPGQSATVATGATTIKYTGTGWAIKWAVGAASALFNGITIENLHVQGNSNSAGGIWLGNASNCLLRDVTVSDFKNATTTGTGVKIGDTTTTGAQYNTLENVSPGACDIGLDIFQANGTRVIGGHFEDVTPTPRTGTYGIRVRTDSDTTALIGIIIQGWDTLLDLAATGASALGVRCEAFKTVAYNISGQKCSVLGGSINNSINGSVGTGIILTSNSLACLLLTATVSSVATKLTDSGSRNTYIVDPDQISRLEAAFIGFQTGGLRVNKQGAGAQDPTMTMESNGTVGPTIGTESAFGRMVINHAYSGAAGISLRVAGADRLTLGTTKPAVTGSRGGNAALASLLTQLAALNLITDSTTA